MWSKSVKYDVRKNFADSRIRVKGRFVKKEEQELMLQTLGLTGSEHDNDNGDYAGDGNGNGSRSSHRSSSEGGAYGNDYEDED